MNILKESSFYVSSETRPPVVGKESFIFHEASSPSFPVSCSSFPKNMECKMSTYNDTGISDSTNKTSDTVSSELSRFESGECMEQSPNPSPPPAYKWARSLQCLLDDMQGIELFQKFLRQEGQDTRCLDFLFACRGVKKTAQTTGSERLLKLVHVLYEKKVKRINAISEETKREIKRKISSKNDIDVNIFDEAQRQVESSILNTTYPNFLMSDLYIQHLDSTSQDVNLPGRECLASPEDLEYLPTLHEDSELQFSEKQQLMMRKESLRRKLQRSSVNHLIRTKPEVTYLKSPYSVNSGEYHARYGSILTTSAQDSELQSLSSDAQTDDTMSQTDSSVDYSFTRSKQKRLMKNKNVYLNRDCLTHHNIIPRTQRLQETDKFKNNHDFREFHDQVNKKLIKLIEEEKAKEKLSERLKNIETPDYSRPEVIGSASQKSCKPAMSVFDSNFFIGQTEDNDQDILDRHVSRVFDDLGQTPVLSPVCASPPVARPTTEIVSNPAVLPQVNHDLSYTSTQKGVSPFSVFSATRHRREHDARSSDSGAVTEWISDDNLASMSQDSSCTIYLKQAPVPGRFSRDQLRRSSNRRGCFVNDSASSCVDSGISEVCEPVLPSHSKVDHWLETNRTFESKKETKNAPTSPVLSRSSASQKAIYRSVDGVSEVHSFEAVVSRTACVQPLPPNQDLSMPLFSVPDTTTNLIEARRRLEDDGKLKTTKSRYPSGFTKCRQSFRAYDTFEDGISHRKQSKKSPVSVDVPPTCNYTISVAYSYGQGTVPYMTKYQGRNITLKNFKSLLTKRGNFKYYFKKEENAFGTGTVLEEVSDDHAILPLWENKVFCVIEKVDNIATSVEDERIV